MSTKKEPGSLLFKINNWFERFGALVIKNRTLFFILTLLIIVGASMGLKNLKVGLNLDNYFSDDDPVLLNKQLFSKTFGNNDFIGVLVDADSVFDREVLNVIRALSHELRDSVPFADEIVSLTDIYYVMPVNPMRPSQKAVFNTSDLDLDSLSDKQLQRIINLFDQREGIKGRLYAEDYTQTWIMLRLKDYPHDTTWTHKKSPIEYVGKIAYDIVDKYNKKYSKELEDKHFKLTAAGNPITAYRRNAESFQEMTMIVSLAALIAIVLIIFMTRSFRASIGIIITVAGAILIVFGIKGFMREAVDSTFMLLPILLTIAVAVAYSIHFTAFYKKGLELTGDKRDAVLFTMKDVGWPIFFTAFTTIVSLTSFMFVPIAPIKWAGITAALSIFIVYLMLMFFYPAILTLGKNMKVEIAKKAESSFWETKMQKLSALVLSHGKSIFVVFVLLLVVMFLGILKIEVNLNTREMFGTRMPHVRDMVYIMDSKIATNHFYNVMLMSDEEGFFKKLENAQKVEALEEEIKSSEMISDVHSFTDVVCEMYQALKKDNPKYYTLPPSNGAYKSVVKRVEKYNDKRMKQYVSEDYKAAQIFVKMPDYKSKPFINHIDSVKATIAKLFPKDEYPGLSVHFSGYAIQFSTMNHYVTSGLVNSFGVSLVIVLLLMTIAFGSFKQGLIAMIPNITPVIIAGGFMGFLGYPLEFVTMTIAPMVLGLAVDDTIHFINNSKLQFLKYKNYNKAFDKTFMTVGQALTKSSIILICTFLAFTVAKMNNMVHMGVLTVIAIFSALIADFFVTPTVLRMTKAYGKEESI